MGMWYDHWLLVKDLTWQPSKAHAEAIHQALVKWNFVDEKPTLFRIVKGKATRIKGSQIEASGKLPTDLVMAYKFKNVEQLRRDLWTCDSAVLVVLGSDFKVFVDDYGDEIAQVVEPPQQGSRRVKPYSKYPHVIGDIAYPANRNTKPPKVELNLRCHATGERFSARSYSGVWRSGVMINFGSVPDFVWAAERSIPQLPEAPFVSHLQRSLGTKLVQIGFVH